GDTITIFFDLKNFLEPASDLKIVLSSTNPNVSVLSGSQTVAQIGYRETVPHVGPFQVLVKPNTLDNTPVVFRLDYTANSGTYHDYETFTVEVALDYINYNVNRIATTISSTGRVGY